jgi:hypothetical protein
MEKNLPLKALPKVRHIPADLLSIIIWGVFDKFNCRNQNVTLEEYQEGNDLKKTALVEAIIKDVFKFCNAEYSKHNSNNAHIDPKVVSMIQYVINGNSSKSDQAKNLSDETKPFIHKRAFDGFKDLLPLASESRDLDKKIAIELARWQLEALCLYAYEKTYDELRKTKHRFYVSDNRIHYIRTPLRDVFIPTLQSIFESLELADSKCRSIKLMRRACKMFNRETESLCKAFSDGHYFVPEEDYLGELMSLMEDCDAGFGISIPEFNPIWNLPGGENILQMNLKQSEGLIDKNKTSKNSSPWIRIFFLEGIESSNPKLSTDEENIIKKQLKHGVKVYIVFKQAWEHLKTKELQGLDFAISRIDNCPTLMGTQFEHSKTKGVFYTNETKPEEYYNLTLDKILIEGNCQYIFEPKKIDVDGAFELGGALGRFDLENLKLRLKSIYEVAK